MHRSRTAQCLVAAGAAAALLGLVGTGSAATTAKPKNEGRPWFTGNATVGSVLTGHDGQWSGSPTDFNTWWLRCGPSGGNCRRLDGTGGATTYTVRGADAGHRIRFSVGAANADGRTWADSAASAVVPTSSTPTNVRPPTVSGRAVVGAVLSGSRGSWAGHPTDFNTFWLRCDSGGNNCADIPGTGGHTHYRVTSADVGARLRYTVGAANEHGRTWANSAATAVVGKSAPPPPSRVGCPSTTSPDDVSAIGPPARLILDNLEGPSVVTSQTQTLILRIHVSSSCGGSVRGALVYVTAVPFFQFAVPSEQSTDSNGWVEVHMQRLRGFPVSPRQELVALYARARKPGDSPLGGISAARLFSVHVNLHA